MGLSPEKPAGDVDRALIEESLALLAAFREIKSAQARSTLVWLAQSLADNGSGVEVLEQLGASGSPKTRRPGGLA